MELWRHRRWLGQRAQQLILRSPQAKTRRPRWTVHTRMMLVGTVALLVIGFGLLLTTEWRNPATLGPMGVPQKILAAIGLSAFPAPAGSTPSISRNCGRTPGSSPTS